MVKGEAASPPRSLGKVAAQGLRPPRPCQAATGVTLVALPPAAPAAAAESGVLAEDSHLGTEDKGPARTPGGMELGLSLPIDMVGCHLA